MKKIIIKLTLASALVFPAVFSAVAADPGATGIEIGKIIFKNESSLEVMLLSSKETPSLYVVRGSTLQSGKGSSVVKMTVTDICGQYIRCAVDKQRNRTLAGLKDGEPVFFTDSSNEKVKYGDAKILLASLVKVYENFIFRVESVEDPAAISGFMDSFSTDIENLIPEIDRLYKKYPELRNFYTEPPAELKYESDTLRMLEPALKNAFFKINLYSADPAVKKSIEKLNGVLARLKETGK